MLPLWPSLQSQNMEAAADLLLLLAQDRDKLDFTEHVSFVTAGTFTARSTTLHLQELQSYACCAIFILSGAMSMLCAAA